MEHILGPRPASQPHYLVQSGREDHQAFMHSIEEGEDSEKENLEGILYRSKYAISKLYISEHKTFTQFIKDIIIF